MKAALSLATIAVALLAFTGQVHAQSNIPTQKPAVIRTLETKILKQHKITDCAAAQSPIEWEGITISDAENGLSISGYDQAGGRWQAIIPASSVLSCEVWSTTLVKGHLTISLFLIEMKTHTTLS